MSKNISDLKYRIANNNIGTSVGAALIVIIFFAVLLGISWIATCGIIKLITLCFGWTFKWGISTGIWLIMCLLSSTFKSHSSK